MKKIIRLLFIVFLIIMIIGCTAGPNQLKNRPDKEGKVAGFWSGLWNGFIILFSFIISLFNDNVTIYEVHNSGGWYNFGFLLGIMFFFGGSGGGACSRKRK